MLRSLEATEPGETVLQYLIHRTAEGFEVYGVYGVCRVFGGLEGLEGL